MRYRLVAITLTGAMVAGMLLSPKLWLTERYYPHVPVWDGLPTIPPPWDKVIFGAMLFLLGLAAVLPRRWTLLSFVAIAAAWSLWDQSRWQPWFYQYLFMLAALGFAAGGDPERCESGLNACRFILAMTYIWSGIQKINVNFATDIYPWILEPLLPFVPEGLRGWLSDQGWTAAFVECSLGLLLLVWPLRLLAVVLLGFMHAAILYSLSPRGHDWNSVVWPWNIAMIVLNILLFVKTPTVMPWQIVWPRRLLITPVILVLFGVMPLFSFYGCWDSYLSAALYSGNTIDGHIYVSEDIAMTLPPEVRDKHLQGNYLYVSTWAIDELNVPDYPARRVFRGIARRLGPPEVAILDIQEAPNWLTGKRVTTRENPQE